MKLLIHGRNLEITPALRDYTQTKLERATSHFGDAVREADVHLSVEVLGAEVGRSFGTRTVFPTVVSTDAALTASYGMLGEVDKAEEALQQVLASRPTFADAAVEALGTGWGPGRLPRRSRSGSDPPRPPARCPRPGRRS